MLIDRRRAEAWATFRSAGETGAFCIGRSGPAGGGWPPALVAQSAERVLGKDEVIGSIPIKGLFVLRKNKRERHTGAGIIRRRSRRGRRGSSREYQRTTDAEGSGESEKLFASESLPFILSPSGVRLAWNRSRSCPVGWTDSTVKLRLNETTEGGKYNG